MVLTPLRSQWICSTASWMVRLAWQSPYVTMIIAGSRTIWNTHCCACRLAELNQELQRYKPAHREQQVAYKPASRTSAARPATATVTAGATPAPASTGFCDWPGRAEADAEGGTPCSKYAWELQDLHTRMAAAIAHIRYDPVSNDFLHSAHVLTLHLLECPDQVSALQQ